MFSAQISCCDSFFIQLKAYYKFTSIFSFEMCVIWSRIAWYTNENNIKYLSIIDSGSTLLCFGNILLCKFQFHVKNSKGFLCDGLNVLFDVFCVLVIRW